MSLIGWWKSNARDYPWRRDRTVYRTLIAEVMLRRTRSNQVVPVFQRFMEQFPTLAAAVSATPGDLRDLLYPLGLSWRTENIIALVRETYERFGDSIPDDYAALKELPGVGEYVASAVACFSAGYALPIIDTNVVRVLGRHFDVDISGEARRRSEMRDLARCALDREHPIEYNYAILDFAACVCTARRPVCLDCPLTATCSKNSLRY